MGQGVFIMRSRSLQVGLITALAVISVLVLTRPSESSPLPPMMSPADMKQFGILRATDLTGAPSDTLPPTVVKYSDAVGIAARATGRSPQDARVLHGSAKPIFGEPARSVWVVLFNNPQIPVLGPAGALRVPAAGRYLGVEIDDQTGEVLTWFMH